MPPRLSTPLAKVDRSKPIDTTGSGYDVTGHTLNWNNHVFNKEAVNKRLNRRKSGRSSVSWYGHGGDLAYLRNIDGKNYDKWMAWTISNCRKTTITAPGGQKYKDWEYSDQTQATPMTKGSNFSSGTMTTQQTSNEPVTSAKEDGTVLKVLLTTLKYAETLIPQVRATEAEWEPVVKTALACLLKTNEQQVRAKENTKNTMKSRIVRDQVVSGQMANCGDDVEETDEE